MLEEVNQHLSSRVTAVETQFSSFTKRYEEDRDQDQRQRQKDQDHTDAQFGAVFRKLDVVANGLSVAEASRGRVPTSLIVTLVLGLPAIIAPSFGMVLFFMNQTVSPIESLLERYDKELMRQRETQVGILVNQARIEERQKFILEKKP